MQTTAWKGILGIWKSERVKRLIEVSPLRGPPMDFVEHEQ